MVRQPREAVGEDALLELPAGKLDIEGETPLECAQRELAEEVGKAAGDWRELKRFYTSPGFATEEVTSSWPPSSTTAEPSPRRGSGSRSSRCRWTSSTRRSSAATTRSRWSGC